MSELGLETAAPEGPETAQPPPLTRPNRPMDAVIIRGIARARVAAHEPATSAGGSIQLNFAKADLPSVVDAILGTALGVPYSVDPRVNGTVTLVSQRPMGRDEALEVLDGVLRMNSATLIRGDSMYRVVPIEGAHQKTGGLHPATARVPGYAVSVYVPSYTAAASLQGLIDPLYKAAGAVQADAEHNLLMITGGIEERRALLEAARLFDQDWLAGRSVGIFPLSEARPQAIVDELQDVLGESGKDGSALRITPIERLNAVMVVAVSGKILDRAAEWVRQLDRAGAGERTLHVYYLQHAKARDVGRLLTQLFGKGTTGGFDSGSSVLPPGTRGAHIATAANLPSLATPAGTPASGMGTGAMPAPGLGGGMAAAPGMAAASPQTGPATPGAGGGFAARGFSDSAGQGEDLADLTDNGSGGDDGPRIVPDLRSNVLAIMATAQEYQIIEAALGKLDVMPAQVLIEATIAEVVLNRTLQYGVQYFLRGRVFKQKGSSLGLSDDIPIPGLMGKYPGANAILGPITDPSVVISALDEVTTVKVISSPQVVVTDAHEAVVSVGTKVPLLTQQAVSTISAGSPMVNNVEYHDTGVILKVMPRINAAGVVTMDVVQEVSTVVPSPTDPLTPNIDQRRIESSVAVRSGQTVVLGGLIAEDASDGRSGVPILSTLPVFGPLFGQNSEAHRRTELIIFITPHVVRSSEDAHRLTDELMGRMRSMQPLP